MDEYIRRGEAIEQFEDSTSAIPEKLARIRIERVPAADVVEVVRCRECIYLEKDSKFDMTGDGNEDARFCGIIGCCTNDDWFCADGERKDGGQDDGD